MAEKKDWRVGWLWFNEDANHNQKVQVVTFRQVTLKEIYDKINDFNKDNLEAKQNNRTMYYLQGEAK